jgi:hypothetical protein
MTTAANTLYSRLGKTFLILDFHHPFAGNTLYEELTLFAADRIAPLVSAIQADAHHFGLSPAPHDPLSHFSGGERVILALITALNILVAKQIQGKPILLLNVLESLDRVNRRQILRYCKDKTGGMEIRLYTLADGEAEQVILP